MTNRPFLYSVEREFPVTVDELWNAWIDPAALSAWYSPTDLAVLSGSVTNEARVGGVWAVGVDVAAHGFVAYFFGTYTEVAPNARLVHTMHYTQDRAEFEARVESPLAHRIEIDFDDRGASSWVRFSQFGELPDGEPDRAKAGMESYFDNLGRFLATT